MIKNQESEMDNEDNVFETDCEAVIFQVLVCNALNSPGAGHKHHDMQCLLQNPIIFNFILES